MEIPPVIPPAATLDPAGELPGFHCSQQRSSARAAGCGEGARPRGSAIFSTGGNSLSTGVGEPIGSNGWILEQVQARSVVIRQGSDTLQLSLGR